MMCNKIDFNAIERGYTQKPKVYTLSAHSPLVRVILGYFVHLSVYAWLSPSEGPAADTHEQRPFTERRRRVHSSQKEFDNERVVHGRKERCVDAEDRG
jgi:hypothetical protein